MIYVDTSALVKLVVQEAETVSLQAWIRSHEGKTFFASQVARIELMRAVARAAQDRIERAREVLRGLRSLDAIHLATADSLRTHVNAFVTYDGRLARAAKSLGLDVHSP